MVFLVEMVALPFTMDEDGNIKIKGTRVPIDNIILRYQHGHTPEQIIDSFDVLKLSDVYATIAYYLDNKDEIDVYLAKRHEQAEEIRQKILAEPHMTIMRERFTALKRAESGDDNP